MKKIILFFLVFSTMVHDARANWHQDSIKYASAVCIAMISLSLWTSNQASGLNQQGQVSRKQSTGVARQSISCMQKNRST